MYAKTLCLGFVVGGAFMVDSSSDAFAAGNSALPTNGVVTAGQASITQSGNAMTVKQTSNRAVVNWDSYNVGANAKVTYQQPNSKAVMLNRVTGASASQIDGAVSANGQIIISNANGVTFGSGAQVDAAAVVATTMNQSDQDFMAGKNTWTGNGKGAVVNQGKITVTEADGYVALLAPEVRNEGYVLATKGAGNTIAMASGQQVTLNFQNGSLIGVTVDVATYDALIENKRVVQTRGGTIVVAASAANQLMRSVIRNTGKISASALVENGGNVSLVANTVVNTGKISANTKAEGATAGNITVNATSLTQAGKVSAQGKASTANGGQISLVGQDITLASGSTTSAKGGANGGLINIGTTGVTYTTNADGSHSNVVASGLAKTVTVQAGAVVDASSTNKGNGGEINVWSSLQTTIAGTLNATGGVNGGNGGSIETSSVGTLNILGSTTVNVAAPMGKRVTGCLTPTI